MAPAPVSMMRGEKIERLPAAGRRSPSPHFRSEHSLTLWNVGSGRRLDPVLYGHTQTVSSVAFSGDGRILVSGGADDQIRLWDVETRELIGSLAANQQAVNHIAFEPRKELLASVGADHSIVIWDLDLEHWNKRACRIANRNLTRTEWNTYLGTRPWQKTCPDL